MLRVLKNSRARPPNIWPLIGLLALIALAALLTACDDYPRLP